jgi:predicted nucleic-acid-binding protein
MQAIDTNLLVRLFVNDDAAQGKKVRDLFDSHSHEDAALWVADIVLVELVWTLDRTYGRSREEIATALRALAGSATVLLESGPAVAQAINLFEAGPADFADSLLVCKAAEMGCEAVRTFDRRMRSLPGVKLL